MRRVLTACIAVVLGCGGGGAHRLDADVDGPPVSDAASDAPIDAIPDAPPDAALPRPVLVNGTCFQICLTQSDPDGDGWGYENNASCVMPDSAPALESPFCDSPMPQQAYETTPATITDATTSVAVLPRPPHITVGSPTNCPHLASGLTTFDASWIAGDGTVNIPANTKAVVHGNDEIPSTTLLRRVIIPATSELIFADQPGTFRVTDVDVMGALRLGSSTCRLQSNITFVFDTDEDVSQASVRNAIFQRAGLGIMVDAGATFDVFGKLYQPTWTRLGATAAASSSQITLAESVDWQVGQKLVVVTSDRRDYPYTDQNEVRTITATTGTVLTLDAPLAYSHYGGSEYQVEVGLLSHNIAFKTSSSVLAAAPTFGGHIMIHSKNAHVSGVELYGLGQQNFLARYPLHFHHAGDVAGSAYFTDSSVWRSNWRCAVIHRTDRALVSRNVSFDVFGHCYYLEDGMEMNNEVSYNLAARVKILGPVDQASLDALATPSQLGFTLQQSAAYAQPADRAAAGFYITNGNNKIIGNAASGGFAGYSLPSLPKPIGGNNPDRIFPIRYGVSYFDGNSAHSAGYFWGDSGCVYAGGILTEVTSGSQTILEYTSGRTTDWNLLRHTTEIFNNTKTFLCETGITHWGSQPRIVNFEAWDNSLIAKLFGSASIQSSLAVGKTGNTAAQTVRPLNYYQRGFQFYDTGTQTILKDVIFREFHHDPNAGALNEYDACALLGMVHSNQYTPQRMNASAGLHFVNVDDAQRFCLGDSGTLSSRNFNLLDTDGTATAKPGDGLTGPRLVGSGYSNAWHISPSCLHNSTWGLWLCPLSGTQNVASVGVLPNNDVQVQMYGLDNTSMGTNYYSNTSYIETQITGPSGVGWHHSFPNSTVPPTFDVQVIQVPTSSFVLLSFSLPPGVSCSINNAAWTAKADLPALLSSTGAAYTTAQNTCFVRIPPTDVGSFEASGLSSPNQTWRGNPTPTTYFTINTGCTTACTNVTSTLPTMP